MATLHAHSVARAGHWEAAIARCVMTYDARFLRRKVIETEDGQKILVDFEHTTSLGHRDALITQAGAIEIFAADEPLLAVQGDLIRLAWHIGNRHTPAQIEPDRILIQRDKVMADMLAQLDAEVTEIIAPFTPEGGAYGHGRTHGHDHSHEHVPAHEH